jgi:hypothetical protein
MTTTPNPADAVFAATAQHAGLFAGLEAEVVDAVYVLHPALLDLAEHFTCTEAEAVATILRTVRCEEVAEAFLDAHAEGDEEGDDHWPGTDTNWFCPACQVIVHDTVWNHNIAKH